MSLFFQFLFQNIVTPGFEAFSSDLALVHIAYVFTLLLQVLYLTGTGAFLVPVIIQKGLFVFVCLHAWLFFCATVACLLVPVLDPLRLPRFLGDLGVVKVRAHIFLAVL